MAARKTTQEEFIKKCINIHGVFYNYDKSIYTEARNYINIICPLHGEFVQKAANHLKGQKCPECAKKSMIQKNSLSFNDFVKNAHRVHDNQYEYYEDSYINAITKTKINCLLHGDFWQLPANHVSHQQGCPECARVKSEGPKFSTQEFINKSNKIHNFQYLYDKTIFTGVRNKVIITCSIHGGFEQIGANHLRGHGCPECGRIKRTSENIDTYKVYDTQSFIYEAGLIWDFYYIYDKTEYINQREKVIITCPIHGDFEQLPQNHLKGHACLKCSEGNISKKEINLSNWLSENNINFEIQNKTILFGKHLDIYITNKKVAIEFNGKYYHSSLNKNKNYHYLKSFYCEKQGIRLIHVWEWMWDNPVKQKILKNIILSACGLIENKIYARKCKSEIIDLHTCSKETKQEIIDFFNNNNINGYRGAKYCCLLRYNSMLVHAFTFGNTYMAKRKYEYELIRGASKLGYSVIGGSSKLWSLFIKEINPSSVVYYVDYNYFDGKSLKHLKPEFKYIRHSLSFWNYWVSEDKIKNREPHNNQKIKQLIESGKVIPIISAGTKTYVYQRSNNI